MNEPEPVRKDDVKPPSIAGRYVKSIFDTSIMMLLFGIALIPFAIVLGLLSRVILEGWVWGWNLLGF